MNKRRLRTARVTTRDRPQLRVGHSGIRAGDALAPVLDELSRN